MATQFITVSIEIMHDKNLTPNQKFILAEIQQLSQLDKGCIASNQHFAELIGITKQGVSKAINELAENEYITIDNAQTKRNFGRVITINYRKSAINYRKSAINSGLQSKENKTKNKTKNIFDDFLDQLKSSSKYKTKVTKTRDGEKLFKEIEDKGKLFSDYLKHQEEKKEFSVRITSFMEDYKTVYASQQNTEDEVRW
jgi:Mn-dependent DtxR family transcriptional regulator